MQKYHDNHNHKVTTTPTHKKGKSLSGRKPGYKMKEWQKEVQLTALRNRDLENFNIFLYEFANIFRKMSGERFFLATNQVDRDLFFPEDHTYILEKVLQRQGLPSTNALFLYRNVENPCKKACLKTYEQYAMTRDRQLFPIEKTTREELFQSIRTAAFREDLRFPEQQLICKNITSLEEYEFAQLILSSQEI